MNDLPLISSTHQRQPHRQRRRQTNEQNQARQLRHKSQSTASILQFILCIAFTSAFHSPAFSYRKSSLSQRSVHRSAVALSQSTVESTVQRQPESLTTALGTSNRTQNVRFISPLLEYGYRSAVDEYENGSLINKPLLLYLPGFDGTFLSPFLQFPELHTICDIRCMTIGTDDRSTFAELSDIVLQYLQDDLRAFETTATTNVTSVDSEPSTNTSSSMFSTSVFLNLFGAGSGRKQDRLKPKRPVYLAGESFGGILALDVTNRLLSNGTASSNDINLQGLTLINPATCFDRSRLAAEGPAVAELPAWLYTFGLMRLLPLFADEYSLAQLGLMLTAKALPSVIDTAEREAYLGRVALSLPFVLPFMTQETLKWRLNEWLAIGCDCVANQLGESAVKLKIPVLIVAGERDGTLPSIAEAERLAGILPDVWVHVVEGAGHASTCGSRVDLAALFRSRFKSLSPGGSARSRASLHTKRTSMKDVAANRTGAYFGMEPRYDNASVGLSPLLYWNKLYWKKANHTSL